jgi:hypothetical protein
MEKKLAPPAQLGTARESLAERRTLVSAAVAIIMIVGLSPHVPGFDGRKDRRRPDHRLRSHKIFVFATK